MRQLMGPTTSSRSTVFEDLCAHVFEGEEVMAHELLQLLALGHRLGVQGLFSGLLRSWRQMKSSAGEDVDSPALTRKVVTALVNAFTSKPDAALMPALLVVSAAVPLAMANHARRIAVYLAVGSAPSGSDEVIALGACGILADVLGTFGRGATQALSPWAWARLDLMVSSQGSRLARPAMRCLCIAATSEGDSQPIIKHLRKALHVLQSEVEHPTGNPAVVRAAWVASTACEFCDLDKLVSFRALEMQMPKVGERTVGRFVAAILLRLFHIYAAGPGKSAAPALVLALGFVLRRHVWLVTTPSAIAAMALGLRLAPGQELLAERTSEAFAQLLDSFTDQAERSSDERSSKASRSGPSLGDASAHLAQHQSAVLALLRHGLHRRAEAADAPLRSKALSAARGLQRAGLGHPGSMAAALIPALFADRALRRGAALLLCEVVNQDQAAVASALAFGMREAFGAMLWHAPQQLSLKSKAGLAKAVVDICQAFDASRRQNRLRWIRALLAEMQELPAEGFAASKRLPTLPSSCASTVSRLLPFNGGRQRLHVKTTVSADAGKTEGDWSDARHLLLLYSQFVASVLIALPLNEAEVEVVTESCKRFLDLRAAAVVSAHEHCQYGTLPENVFAVCVSSAASVALLQTLSGSVSGSGVLRVEVMQAAFQEKLPSLQQASARALSASGDDGELAEWLASALEDAPCASKRGSATSRPRGRPPKASDALSELTPPKKRRVPCMHDAAGRAAFVRNVKRRCA
eukprot:TRINITY_DN22253_c0_g1_i2.p1 TRINITY_DN22253_c0_g1~~TRINITY_DN22253_c0_g1_i2.p1  ORF type:complete len:751 (-),score=170.48 TRINITY_DN22253_c0_g1_i2:153-2405(-)